MNLTARRSALWTRTTEALEAGTFTALDWAAHFSMAADMARDDRALEDLAKVADLGLTLGFVQADALRTVLLSRAELLYSPDQPRDAIGRFGEGGGGESGGTKGGPRGGSGSGSGGSGSGGRTKAEPVIVSRHPKAEPLFRPSDVAHLPAEALQPTRDKVKLYEMAKVAHEQQLDILDRGKGLDSKLGATVIRGDKGQGTEGLDKVKGPVIAIGPIKSEARAQEKADTWYKGNMGRMADIVRASVAVDNYRDIKRTIDILKESGMKLAAAPKDRFANPTKEGYRDTLLRVKFPNGMVGELQVHVKSMLAAKEEGHKYYNDIRKVDERVEREGGARTAEERATVERATAASKAIYDKAWVKALGG